ncbi:uncharacterized protein LOC125468514 [Pyrus x bretschneideri]|uniref:uncharacterized protein LOC125468514 n=1 Tax=Pyrus x bretschneideri TaxID=225117 RepID=UPI00202F0E44|nr:uncharacterized protein LOC125468514 [Pyrus x bretschneideri]
MANKYDNNISLKALVKKGSNKVIFIECDNDFVDVLFSFLTIPMGTIIRLTREHPAPSQIGCLNNLYESVENVDARHFPTEACKEMLLHPRAAESHCKNLRLKTDNGEATWYFLCSEGCTRRYNPFSHYKGVLCECGEPMDSEISLSELSEGKLKRPSFSDGGVFCKEATRFIISDDLEVISPLYSAVSPFLTTVGVTDANSTEEMTFNVGVEEVLNLLLRSFVSKTPFTDALLKQAGEDFVNLLFSFLTVPLGEMLDSSSSSKGCIDQLYKSVQDLDEQYLKSNYHKKILLTPKMYPGFCYDNHLLGVEDALEASYHYARHRAGDSFEEILTTDKTLIPSSATTLPTVPLKFKYCKNQGDLSARGFLNGPTMFTITDSLVIRPISPLFGISVLNEMKVPFSDIEVQNVKVGREEALFLSVTSFRCDSALTHVFLSHKRRIDFYKIVDN